MTNSTSKADAARALHKSREQARQRVIDDRAERIAIRKSNDEERDARKAPARITATCPTCSKSEVVVHTDWTAITCLGCDAKIENTPENVVVIPRTEPRICLSHAYVERALRDHAHTVANIRARLASLASVWPDMVELSGPLGMAARELTRQADAVKADSERDGAPEHLTNY